MLASVPPVGSIDLVLAPWSIGLRPSSRRRREPGTWRAPAVLQEAGLSERLAPHRVIEHAHPPYALDPTPGTRVRNALTMREHGLRLADAVAGSLRTGRLPVVVGGDCSVLLGCLAGARRLGKVGLIHIDAHPDFAHPVNHDFTTLGAAAGMDLALATGRGELLLTHWPGIGGPLVDDAAVAQLGDRTSLRGSAAPSEPALRYGIDDLLARGVALVAEWVRQELSTRGYPAVWLHIDLDVLDQAELPAVDSPGSPGLTFDQLRDLVAALIQHGPVVGVDLTIYDPDLDPDRRFAPQIVDCIATALGLHR